MKEKIIFLGNNGKSSMNVLFPKVAGDIKLIQRRQFRKSGNFFLKEYLHNNAMSFNRLNINNFNFNNKIVIRWGNRIEVPQDENTIIYNDNKSARRASNKKLAREIFLKNDILCPRLLTPDSELTFPIIARPLEHTKGENFVVLNDKDSFIKHYKQNSEEWYYSEFIDKDREFRVHCAHGKILAIMEKPRGEGIAWNRVLNTDPFVRVKQNDYNHTLSTLALKSMKAIELDFGGVDIMLKDKTPYVIEINTSPSIETCQYVNDRYAMYFDWLLKSEEKREHWDFTTFKKGKSLAWKNEQFN